MLSWPFFQAAEARELAAKPSVVLPLGFTQEQVLGKRLGSTFTIGLEIFVN